MYPVMLDLSDRVALIVGGGRVAARKAAGLLAAGVKSVRCVAPRFCDEIPAGVDQMTAAFAPAHLNGADLVFAATDSADVNDVVTLEAHQRGLWVNRADAGDEAPGDFTIPAVWRSGALAVAVSAAGSPALAARVRDEIASHLDPALAKMAEAMVELRPRIKAAVADPAMRQAILRDLASSEATALLAAGSVESVWQWLAGRLTFELRSAIAGGDGTRRHGEHGGHGEEI